MDNFRKINQLPPLVINSGSMEAVKWIALLSMTFDHANRFFYDGAIYPAYCFGRLAMPLFAFIFAYNLARPDALQRGLYSSTFNRLILFGLLATPAYIAMRSNQQWLPLNIMFSLAQATACLYLYEEGGFNNRMLAVVLFYLGGYFVEYNWVTALICITTWFYCKEATLIRLILCLLPFVFLNQNNLNHWALLAIPIIILASQVDIKIPRIKHFFYYFYPIHLSLFYFLSRL